MYLPLKIIKVVPKMSFPPGPPLHIPGMPPVPPMIPPPYAVPPLGGMIPMTVGMMPAPMMAPVPMTMPAPVIPPHHKLSLKKVNTTTTSQNFTYKREQNTTSESTPDVNRGPPVTVFVGNITERAPDSLVRQILQRCGIVFNWKRVQGANGKLQAFGFCEYGDPESALRAIRLLHDWEIGGKKLVVKVDAKTKEKLDEYKAKVLAKQQDGEKSEGEKSEEKEANEGEKEKEEGETSDDTIDELTKQKDEIIRAAIQALLRTHEAELSRPVEQRESPPPTTTASSVPERTTNKPATNDNSPKPRIDYERLKKNELDEMDLEEDKKSLIHREIDKFRDTYKRAEEEREKDKDRDRRSSRRREYESPDSRTRDRDRDRDRDRERDREREKRYHRDRNSQSREDSIGSSGSNRRRRRSRERARSPRSSPIVTRETRERSRERPVERSRSASQDKDWSSRDKDHANERTKERDREKDWDKDEEEEAYERKKLERKLREKEAIYQERLRNWEARERRRAKEYEKERIKAEEQKRDELKEARRLKEFLEDYDDERDDPKYFKGSALLRRMKEREKEIEEDLLDRQREKEELDELRKKLAEEGHPDPEAEVERFLQEESRLANESLAKEETPDSDHEVTEKPIHLAKLKPLPETPSSPLPEPVPEVPKQHKTPVAEDESTQNSFSGFSDLVTHEESKPLGFTSLRIGGSPTQVTSSPGVSQNNIAIGKRKMAVDEVFNENDDEPEQKKKRKLIPLDDSQDDASKTPSAVSQMTLEEKRKHIKNLIEKIPTEKSELFSYNLDWSVVDKVLMEKRIRPWINKKIIEYIGEEEPTLVEFICSKVMAGSAAQSILDDVSMVLDEEAEVFVVKMWRLLIYEIEAKKLGLECSQSKS